MIVPVGKNKHQVNQGGLKYESFLNDPNFTKLAADFSDLNNKPNQPGAPVEETASPVEEESPVPGDLQRVMNESNSGAMNESNSLEGPDKSIQEPGMQTGQAGAGTVNEAGKSRQDAMVGIVLKELREANMMPAEFTPDLRNAVVSLSGKEIFIKVPGLPAGPTVQHT